MAFACSILGSGALAMVSPRIRRFLGYKKRATIKLADRMKALEWLTQHMNMATEEQKARIDVMRSKLGENGNEAEAYDWMKAVIQEDGE